MSNWKRKYIEDRKKFKKDLYELAKENKAIIPLIAKTYTAYKHRIHIHKIWKLMGDYPEFNEIYSARLFGQMLCGSDEILEVLAYIDASFFKYRRLLPEKLIMGDSLAIVKKIQRESKGEKYLSN